MGNILLHVAFGDLQIDMSRVKTEVFLTFWRFTNLIIIIIIIVLLVTGMFIDHKVNTSETMMTEKVHHSIMTLPPTGCQVNFSNEKCCMYARPTVSK